MHDIIKILYLKQVTIEVILKNRDKIFSNIHNKLKN